MHHGVFLHLIVSLQSSRQLLYRHMPTLKQSLVLQVIKETLQEVTPLQQSTQKAPHLLMILSKCMKALLS